MAKKNIIAVKISDSEVRSDLDGHILKGLQEDIRKAYSVLYQHDD